MSRTRKEIIQELNDVQKRCDQFIAPLLIPLSGNNPGHGCSWAELQAYGKNHEIRVSLTEELMNFRANITQ